ncbi:phosphopantothenoylcysteine decarboxylase / phosphopantothenate--cysteine ligase [Desulfonatronum thiosulfatophilum]|uniref:Coenzyme A biosynthesis bifunctional protein CoaBC n=1 Tax=Desulfonatronum thiosulfatophilum TaxID=617002 RepID=A0A1G6B898_9BACT|nr:bifunctional phosphopantothenoylcysteine decarboxylase/phosphopantothenate--cysteine ligase CoaBC [Desulfonatronum thiosulfatophilum]SDB16875.1 phosphopantothenoylcysteine decarboxylase / phosphopantothenate--cysteine ligase [Desulfonatronum thiosulfatophilum]
MNFSHTDFTGFSGTRVHLGVCGSISAFRAVDIMRRLQRADITVGVTLTKAAQEFIRPLQFQALTSGPVYEGLFAANQAEYAHLEPAQNADVLLIAPSTANMLAKHAHGIGDDLLSSQLFSFAGTTIHAPAMNPRIWSNPAVQANVAALKNRNVVFVPPETGLMACGEVGEGRLAETEEIFLTTLKTLLPQNLAGKRMLVNLGPTQEFWDPVRVLTNNSSGTMGASIALAAWLLGAEVSVVAGPVPSLWLPRFLDVISVSSALQMHEACLDIASNMDIICCTAAVSDYRFLNSPREKVKKSELGSNLVLELQQNPDILFDIGKKRRSSQFIIGFAAESCNIQSEALRKLKDKNLDLIVANPVNMSDCGFGSSRNMVFIADAYGRQESWPVLPKSEIGMRIVEWVMDSQV